MNDSTTLVIVAYDMPETDTLENQGGEFERLTGTCVALVRLSAEEMEKKVLEEFEKRAGTYDIVDVSAAAIPAFAPHLEPLDDCIRRNEAEIRIEDWSSHIFDMYARYRDKTVTLPWRGSAYLLYYRKDLFEKENLEPPTELNKLLEAAKRLHRPDKDFYGFASAQHNGLHICLDWLPTLWAFGGEIYSETMSALLNSEAAVKALEYYIERNNYAAPGILDFGYYEPLRLMQEGKVAMMQQWSMAAANLENPAESKVSGKVGYIPAPGYPVIGGGGLGVNKYSAHKEIAWEFIKWFTSPEVEKKRVTIGGSPTRSSSFRDPELLARYPYITAIEQALMVGRQRPRHEEWNRIQDTIAEAVWLASAGTKSPTEALVSANARVQEILEWSKELSLLNTVSSLVSQSLNVEEILNNVLDKMIEIERADAGCACLLDETTGKPFLVLQWVGSSGLVEKVAPSKIDEELVRRVVQSEETYVELHPTGREIFKKEGSEAISAGGFQSVVGFRIGTKSRPIGIVIIAFRSPRRFSYRETNLLTVIGRQVGQAIENARLYETVQQELAEHKRAEEALRESEERYRLLFEKMISGFSLLEMVYDENGKPVDCRYLEVNPSHQRHTGLKPSEIIGKGAKEIFGLKDEWIEKYDRVTKTGEPIILKDYVEGLGKWFNVIAYRPKPGLVAVVFENITERKRAEEELRKVNRALKVLSECNQTVVRATEESRLLHEICQIIVEVGEYRLAWVGFAEQDEAKTVRPVAQVGFEDGYLETLDITWADTEQGRGPTGTAIRTGKPAIARNIQTEPHYAPWRTEVTRRGYTSSIALPLLSQKG